MYMLEYQREPDGAWYRFRNRRGDEVCFFQYIIFMNILYIKAEKYRTFIMTHIRGVVANAQDSERAG